MKAVAVALTVGRPAVQRFLADFISQTVCVPLVLWIDDAPGISRGDLPPHVHVVHGAALGGPVNIGPVRDAACRYAIDRLGATHLVMLEDDDRYAPEHVEVTQRALATGAAWVGARRYWVRRLDGKTELHEPHEGSMPGTWGIPVVTYESVGGYGTKRVEDADIARRIGWHQMVRPHVPPTYTYVEHHLNWTRAYGYSRERLKASFVPVTRLEARPLPQTEGGSS